MKDIPGPESAASMKRTNFWHEIRHPFFWVTEEDLPRLRHNAELPFWKPKFDAWRKELRALDKLEITTSTIDFHIGTNKAAHKAAMCYVVDGDPHFGRLIASYLSGVVEFYRRSPDWRVIMGSNGPGPWTHTGQQWGGLAGNHIVDPQMWLSTGHLYDVICGKGFLPEVEAVDFEEMMSQFHQLSCLHEEMHKMDNNRSVWLTAGGYLSAMFDTNRERSREVMDRLRNHMPRFLDTILEDGIHYEIGGYGPGTIAAMQIFARCIRGAEGIDYFKEKVDGVGFEEAYRAWVGTLIPGSSLRIFCYRDRISHWESIGAGYLEYGIPELGWVLSRMHERPWVPMFQHWPQGFEFYTYSQPYITKEPTFRHSHFPAAGMAFLRSSWAAEASSLYFRYGFQGSSHGGGTDKLNIELTCNDEPLIAEPMLTESTHDKNLVIVDGRCQEQCSGRLLYADLNEDQPLQVISALSGFGKWPNRAFLRDPRAEVNYWCTKSDECFPGVARMRRTVVQLDKQVYIVRDTLWSLDENEHDYEWLFHSFAKPELGEFQRRTLMNYQPKRLFYSQSPEKVSRKVAVHKLPSMPLHLRAEKASIKIHWSAFGAALPVEIGISESPARYAFNGSPETGDGLSERMLNRLHLPLHGKDMALISVMIPVAAGRSSAMSVDQVQQNSLDQGKLAITIQGLRWDVTFDESSERWIADCQP